MYKKYILYAYETFDAALSGGNGIIIVDLKGAGAENLEFTISSFFTELLFKYYPSLVTKIVVVDLTWYLKPPVAFIQALLPDSITKKGPDFTF